MTETELVSKRNRLRQWLKAHPEWTGKQMAQAVGMSEGWVKKWRGRLKSTEPDDYRVLWSRSRRPQRVHSKVTPALEMIVLSIRDDPPDGLQRTPGCDAIHYYMIKTMPLKGLVEQTLSLDAYVSHIQQEAVSEWRCYLAHRPRRLPLVA